MIFDGLLFDFTQFAATGLFFLPYRYFAEREIVFGENQKAVTGNTDLGS
jgi:hypothetical protein